ncbi:unnamed protein product [Periconia digitata]|uniref:Uncharacterized protein n=1 Tax=Periconia digitata TaxID=1303443 RepID=A0A9W4UGB3_9PLEO|nr:unnamed protein product [Periconia digitata]
MGCTPRSVGRAIDGLPLQSRGLNICIKPPRLSRVLSVSAWFDTWLSGRVRPSVRPSITTTTPAVFVFPPPHSQQGPNMVTGRNKEHKLYDAVLEQCTQGIQQFSITSPKKRRVTSQSHIPAQNPPATSGDDDDDKENTIHGSRRLIATPVGAADLRPQPLRPSVTMRASRYAPQHGASPYAAPGNTPLRANPPTGSGPPRGGDANLRGSQNMTPQPTQHPVSNMSLKKRAVRVVGAPVAAASAATSTISAAGPATPASSASGAVQQVIPKVQDGFQDGSPALVSQPATTATSVHKRDDSGDELDKLFARVMSQAATSSSTPSAGRVSSTPQRRPQTPSPAPAQVLGDFTNGRNPQVKTAEAKASVREKEAAVPLQSHKPKLNADSHLLDVQPQDSNASKFPSVQAEQSKSGEGLAINEKEHLYLSKAAEYLDALPTGSQTPSADLVKKVSGKLAVSYTPGVHLGQEDLDALKGRLVFAIHTFLNSLPQNFAQNVTVDKVKQTVDNTNGNLLHLCSQFIQAGTITIENLNGVVGLCKAIQACLVAQPNSESKTEPNGKAAASSISSSKDNTFTNRQDGWPAQQKRKSGPGMRTCTLKGVGSVKDLHELQGLVWGGRLESISKDNEDSSFALVKFLTPQGCQKYFEATGNGIVHNGTVVQIEQMPVKNSTNDVVNNCITGDVTRCVRAYHADQDWGQAALMSLARKTGDKKKREVEIIKSGKDAKGQFYIEFRFGNIYDAMSFKRVLMSDEDWETCNIQYGQDPCDAATGPHFKEALEGNGKVIVKGSFESDGVAAPQSSGSSSAILCMVA